ncbi:sigma-70 family RNA polymerase sigma factor [Micromonospora sp. WMMD1082]|uniref:sigma-70 family RNA polymerase sigma factor n=1 Tax=Micromonospora sp. WMMD1082 TaxID=3016104 RepID=UPI0024171398|nr:sigma-70 family RNA polymerase sigma factor [Micromonospora sp. WMMD1082]MDG4792990.1 sigma-70 family RNA polymerase sigma factor [Micromonospora sp. WMMD1082]
MRLADRGGADTNLVIAARAGDPRALDALLAVSLPLVYNVVGRALRGHADVDDVVQETLLRVVRNLPGLRDPAAYRSWLIAIAVRQVRDREHWRRTALDRTSDLDVAYGVPDPAGDFAGMTILRLGLTDQRREVAEATRWLDEDDQALLALWWLEETGELDRAELAAALGLTQGHAAVRIQRMKEQVQASRGVVRALRHSACPGLGELTRSWDGRPGPLWRKRLARHVRECARCAGATGELVPIDRLLAGLPLLPLPPGAAEAILANLPPSTVPPVAAASQHVAPATPHAEPPDPTAVEALGRTAAQSSGGAPGGAHAVRPRLSGLFPVGSAKVAGPIAVAVTVAVLAVGAIVVAQRTGSAPAPVAAPAGEALPAPNPPASLPPPTPSAAPTSPAASPTPRPTPTAVRPAAPPPVVTSKKKGVGVWTFDGVSRALADSGASWYYTWNVAHPGVTTPRGAEFVPMIWGADSVTAGNLRQARQNGRYLLGFNEPDLAGQAEMTVERALDLWPQLEATGLPLGSPAVAWGGDRPGEWLDRFMTGVRERGYRVDFIALHWYGGDFRTANAVDQLRSYLQAVYDRYRLPIWLTEFALIDFSNGVRFPSQAQQAAFLTAATRMLGGLPWLHRYAWFGLPATDKDQTGLFRTGSEATAIGRAFRAAG